MTKKKVYMAIDVHARNCVLGVMDARGKFQRSWRFKTCEKDLINYVESVNAGNKILTLEEGPLAYWISQTLTPYVKKIIIADSREIPLISRNAQKGDKVDVRSLCRLLRLGELKAVYHPEDDRRAVFKAAIQQYIDLRNSQVKLKQKIKAKFRSWGVHDLDGKTVYGPRNRENFLHIIKSRPIRHQLERLYSIHDLTVAEQSHALREAKQLSKGFPEIKEFLKMPGIGQIGALTFDAYIQTPDRFKKKSQLYRYCQLAIRDRTSDGKLLSYKRLDRAGNSELKAMSYRAFTSACNTKTDNEVKQFYQRSLNTSQNHTRARLCTQRKILSVMHGVWRRKEEYQAEKF